MELLKVENLTFTYPKQNPDAAEPEPTLQNVSFQDRKSTRLNSSHASKSRMPSSA